ncbi:MAG: T9SS type A sorting domain-containing protein [Cytophagaceae bacterium]|nr:T9SS type A sorting domain-containing protein [Cytophagaceae bacterium]
MELSGIENSNSTSFTIYRLDVTTVKSASEKGFYFIDTQNLTKGVYIVKITTEDCVISDKIIIE